MKGCSLFCTYTIIHNCFYNESQKIFIYTDVSLHAHITLLQNNTYNVGYHKIIRCHKMSLNIIIQWITNV